MVYPGWYAKESLTDEINFYSTGKGVEKDTAIKASLKGIAEQIRISVSSKYKEESQFTQKYNDKKIVSSIETETKNIDLIGYKVIQSQLLENDQFIVMVSVEKSNILNLYLKKIEKINKLLESSNDFTDYIFLKKLELLKGNLEELELSHMIINSLAKDVRLNSRLAEFQKRIEERENLIAFFIVNSGQQFVRTENVLREALTGIGLKTSAKDGALRIEINGVSDSKKDGNLYFVRQQVEIQVKDSNDSILASKTIEEVSASTISIEDAILNTGAELKMLIKKQGLKKILALEAD